MANRNPTKLFHIGSDAKAALASLDRHFTTLKVENAPDYRLWCKEHGFSDSLCKSRRRRQNERRTFARLDRIENACVARASHIRSLGMRTLSQYEDWCRKHYFSNGLHKNREQLQMERIISDRESAEEALLKSRKLHRDTASYVLALSEGQVKPDSIRNAFERDAVNKFSAKKNSKCREALRQLVTRVIDEPNLCTLEPVIPFFGPQRGNSYLDALVILADLHSSWIRPPETWKPSVRKAELKFGSLIRHLLCRYEVPGFMDAAWFADRDETGERYRNWFMHVANGENIRTADIPVALTKKAAHHFLLAPRYLSIIQALRWGQVFGLGGGTGLARALAGSRLAEILPDEQFWASVIHFFVNNPSILPSQIAPLVDYLYHQKFVNQEIVDAYGSILQSGQPEPDLSMKGRTGAALIRRMEEWHVNQAHLWKRQRMEWQRSGIGEFRLVQQERESEAQTYWTIHELLSSQELLEEGKAMHNCVPTYETNCLEGGSSIWSLRVSSSTGARHRRVLTIEIEPSSRSIVQARGPCNVTPGEQKCGARVKYAPEILRRWAEEEKLTLSKHAW